MEALKPKKNKVKLSSLISNHLEITKPDGKYNGDELKYVKEFLNHSSNEGPSLTQRFEEAVIERIGSKYAVACNSGTSALHMCMYACDVGPGDEVIVPALGVVMDAYVAIHQGATPVFVDICPDTYGVDVEDFKKKITKKTKAIIVVSLQGLSVDMDPILEIAEKHGITVIDDSAQNMLGTYKGRLAGNLGHLNILSFENKKHITSGSEGGMVTTDNEEFAIRARKFGGIGYKHMTANAGRTSLALSDVQDPDYERFDTIGLNYRMSEVQAAVGLAQFERVDTIYEKRVRAAEIFMSAVKSTEILKAQKIPDDITHSHYTVTFEYLGEEKYGISWKEFYNRYLSMGGDGFYAACVVPYLEPVFSNHEKFSKIFVPGSCPNAEKMQKRLMQFKSNYRDLDDALYKANILKDLCEDIDRG